MGKNGKIGKYYCPSCGEKRFFYKEVSIVARRRIDLQNGSRHNKIYHVDIDHIDCEFETVFCGKCEEEIAYEG